MTVEETTYKEECDNCGEYDYLFAIETKNDICPSLELCKKCLLELLKAIVER